MNYPVPPRGEGVEVLAGVSFADPFRALEPDHDAAVLDWQRAQAELCDAYVSTVPGLEQIRERVARQPNGLMLGGAQAAIPRFAGGRWFRTVSDSAGGEVIVADVPFGPGRTVFAAKDERDELDRVPSLLWHSPSPNGKLLAVGICFDGSEANVIRLIEVESGEMLLHQPPHTLMDGTVGPQWMPDSSAFYYVALHGPREDYVLGVFRHDVGQAPRLDPEPVPLEVTEGHEGIGVFVSSCGRFVIANQNLLATRPVALLDLADPEGAWRPMLTGVDATVAGHVIGSEYIAITDHEAPRGRVVAIPVDTDEPAEPSQWREIVPESEAVLRSVTPVGDLIYLAELVDVYSRVRIIDTQGIEVGRVPLPERCSLSDPAFRLQTLVPGAHSEEYLFCISSLTESWGCYRHRPGDPEIETLQAPQVRLDAVVEDLWAVSADGTRVPYHIVRSPDVSNAVPQPTLIWAYGGFNVALVPEYPGAMAAFVESGGVLVHAHLRGGSEFGYDWWQGGRGAQKQNCYSDLFAIAEDLIAQERTTTELLAVTGMSNGGLMSGVAVTQRPDLWRAVVPRVARLDLLGSCREPFGRASVYPELGDPDSAEGVARLAAISPYHLVQDGTSYPATYIDTGATDARCSPRNGRKFAARLQEANSSEHPILLRVWDNVGHGGATSWEQAVEQNTAWLAFVMGQLGMTTKGHWK